jgi:hypothetical protein
LSSLLILALGCLLAGVYMEWLFLLVGLLLLAIVIIVSGVTARDVAEAAIGLGHLHLVLHWIDYQRTPDSKPG